MSPPPDLALSLCQLDATPDHQANMATIEEALAACKAAGSTLAILPEAVTGRGSHDDSRALGRTEDDWAAQLGALSQAHGLCVVWGGIPVYYDEKLYNTSLVFDASGKLIAAYRKIHLFQFSGHGKQVDETHVYTHGSEPVTCDIGGWNVGITICYDLRFPELYRHYVGVDLLLCTAAFTKYTGRDHWEVLARARAIENQCYLAAVNQCGRNQVDGVECYGNSMLVDPWGRMVERLGDEPGSIHRTIKYGAMSTVRGKVPALTSIKHTVQWSV